jgi:hypothetical protein
VYIAIWIDGYIHHWDRKNLTWKRIGQNMPVILKSLNINPAKITPEFLNEV